MPSRDSPPGKVGVSRSAPAGSRYRKGKRRLSWRQTAAKVRILRTGTTNWPTPGRTAPNESSRPGPGLTYRAELSGRALKQTHGSPPDATPAARYRAAAHSAGPVPCSPRSHPAAGLPTPGTNAELRFEGAGERHPGSSAPAAALNFQSPLYPGSGVRGISARQNPHLSIIAIHQRWNPGTGTGPRSRHSLQAVTILDGSVSVFVGWEACLPFPGAPRPPWTLAATAHQRKDQLCPSPTLPVAAAAAGPLERLIGVYIATATATAAMTAATVLSVAALSAAVLASWRRALPPRRR